MAGLSATLYRYQLPLHFPLAVKGVASTERHGVLLQLTSEDGMVGWGDAAPLPGWSREDLDLVLVDLKTLTATIPTGRPDAQWVLGQHYPKEGICASARYAFECAYLGLLAGQAGIGLRSILAEQPTDRLLINALVPNDCQDPPPGYLTYKVKVGRGDLMQEAEWIRRLSGNLPEGGELRLDANRAWTLEEAEQFSAAVADCPIEYLEEPLRDPDQLAAFMERSPIPIAVDETLEERGVGLFEALPGLRAAVLKPALNGGLVDAVRIADAAHRRGMYPVVTSGFESGIGIRALAQLAGAIVPPGIACGLDPYRWIAEDVVEPELEIEEGSLDLARLDRTLSIVQINRLQEIHND